MKYLAIVLVAFVVVFSAWNTYKRSADDNLPKNEEFTAINKSVSTEEEIIYETEVDTQSDCTSFEKYDSKRKVCYFTCTNDADCEKLQSQIDNELNNLAEEYIENSPKKQNEDKLSNEQYVAIYDVKDEKITLTNGKDEEKFHEVWNMFAKISPDEITNSLVEKFVLYNNKKDDSIAHVEDDDRNGKWTLGVNMGQYGIDNKRQDELTLIHEFAHILTLNKKQVDWNTNEENCNTHFTGEGCSLSSSYINQFVQKFWSKKDIESANNNFDVYKKDNFVTEYAATNPEEDIAESFALFVLSQKSNTSNLMKDKKTAFFYDFPELNSIRSSIRKSLGEDIIRNRKHIENN